MMAQDQTQNQTMMTLASSTRATKSVPGFTEFNPEPIPWQDEAIDDFFTKYDFSLGVHEILFSGGVGSAKSMVLAFLGVYMCLKYPGCTGIIARETLGDLRDSLYKRIKQHLMNDPKLVQGYHYEFTDSTCRFKFPITGSEIIAVTWHEYDYLSLGSLEASFVLIEESIALKGKDGKHWYQTLMQRLGRQPHIPVSFAAHATNPGDPDEDWHYGHFELERDDVQQGDDYEQQRAHPLRHVYYSVTKDNIFNPPWYYQNLARDLDPIEADRMLHGKWVPRRGQATIYHQYTKKRNYIDEEYEIDDSYPVCFSWDFNIGEGKPLSCVFSQYLADVDTLHGFGEVVVEGLRTHESCVEIANKGILDVPGRVFMLCGDASGKHKDTRNNQSDWDIIEKFFANYTYDHPETGVPTHLQYTKEVPLSNPPIKTRWNRVNAYLFNALKEVRTFVWKGAPTLATGLRLTKVKKSGNLKEDDSKDYQHITTAWGYMACAVTPEPTINTEQGKYQYL